jgi:hypothetical protein
MRNCLKLSRRGCGAKSGCATGLAGQRWGTPGTWTTEHDSAPITRTSVCRWACSPGADGYWKSAGSYGLRKLSHAVAQPAVCSNAAVELAIPLTQVKRSRSEAGPKNPHL